MMTLTTERTRFLIRACQILIVLGIAGKFYDITAPWKTNDHYNYGGVWTTEFAECLKTTPLSISRGVPHVCVDGKQGFYPAHPPTILFAMWGWTTVFGSAEWAYRFFILTFSAFNVAWVFAIAKRARRSESFPWLAAALQSTFLAGLYFGTHLDFIGEFTVFFVLAAGWLALRSHVSLACIVAIFAGVTAWPGYLSFAPLLLLAIARRNGIKRTLAFGALGVAVGLATMMWLHGKTNIYEFLHWKLTNPGYVKKEKGLFQPFAFVLNFFQSQSRLLGPLFCAMGLFEFVRGDARGVFSNWRNALRNTSDYHKAILIAGGTGFFYAILGHEYVMIHVFLYLFLVPAFALAGAAFLETARFPTGRDRWWMTGIGVLSLATYPYGIYQSSLAHDATNSVLMAVTMIVFLTMMWKGKVFTARTTVIFMALAFAANFSQMMNYRNEPDTQRSFCERARAEYDRTGQPVKATEPNHVAKIFLYCRGIPIVY